LTYLFLEQLLTHFVFMTPWRFIGSATWFVALMIRIFILARKIDGRRKIPFVVIAGTLVYPIIMSLAFFFATLIFPPTVLYAQFDFSTATLWRRTFMLAIEQTIYGTVIGLFLGLGLGFQEKSGPPEIIV
jgi:hypothetical protein